MSSFFRFSEAVSLALHSMVLLAGSSSPLTVREMAERTQASFHHLAKVFQYLRKARLVVSTRGPKGGFVLARPPEQITLLEVYEAIEGPVPKHICFLREKSCPFERCIFGGLLGEFALRFREYLASRTLADVCRGEIRRSMLFT
ncbi:MAG: Rrf2 family transcriptional regulator [Candidatus Caldatribacterium sp.]|uniref:RrF2 family transcriptional regulator n=1 Tax=Candidatus Caldatribacterium sp. TaxID=2282143 RepID=UPI0029935DBF|nr:Rrf2 family transcriptional regulator [Candidatus Caldatribacterium sp.]MCX7730558.1 Rrf2 family transcriptional regulator [Candidatus Caldatribacterium sp.]MDW8081717.1 Rrf2 family transcriptional regulator [Candidatus Calescibacterium sp.]